MQSKLEKSLAILLTVAAIAMAGAVVKREFFGGIITTTTQTRAEYHEDWADAREVGIELANPTAALQIVEFLDIQCSACALYHDRAIAPFMRTVDRDDYSFVVVHRPLPMHEFALAAAHAAECAHAQGAFAPFVQEAFRKQSTFASSPWIALGEQAGVKDLALFSSCLSERRMFPRVSAGTELSTRMQVNATPTILINGFEPAIPPDLATLQRLVEGVKAKRDIRELLERK